MSLFVDQNVLQTEARRLGDASARVDELAASLPSSVDGGVGTAAVLGIISIFAESGGELMSGLAGIGDALTECLARYSEQDLAAAEEINSLAWTD